MSMPRRHSVCPNCGATNVGEQTTCLRCQAPLVEQVPLVRQADAYFAATCPNCSAEVVPGHKFCIACGASLERAAMVEQGRVIPADDATLITSGWQLTIANGPNAGQSFPLGDGARLGRAAGNEIRLADRQVSRHHAILKRVGHGYLITDQGSSNGTYVNGVRISQPILLHSGDTIRIGDTQFTILGEAELPLTGTKETIVCPACGAWIASHKFCTQCGAPLG
jgi:ribosomal protein L32